MGHALQAIVMGPRVSIGVPLPSTLVSAPLPQGFRLIPITEALFDEIARLYESSEGDPHPAFWRLSASLRLFLLALSQKDGVAYIETDYFGGGGEQAAAAWLHGDLIAPPRRGALGPINDSLRSIGVTIQGARDEFEVLQLHHFPSLAAAVAASQPIGQFTVG